MNIHFVTEQNIFDTSQNLVKNHQLERFSLFEEQLQLISLPQTLPLQLIIREKKLCFIIDNVNSIINAYKMSYQYLPFLVNSPANRGFFAVYRSYSGNRRRIYLVKISNTRTKM